MRINKRTSLVLLACPLLLSGCFEDRWDNEISANPASVTVSAADLCKAFDSDESSASQKYKGKVIKVHGPVQETWIEGDRTMVVLSGGKNEEVRCLVSPAGEPDLADLKVGRPTMVKGKCRGVVRGDLALGGCLIEDPLRGLKAKARTGDPQAMFDLAQSLSKTNEAVHDVRRAFGLCCKASERGNREAQTTVMESLAGAWGPETNTPVIWEWLREEAEGGNVEACYLLGMLHIIDEDFGIDIDASVPWLQKASDGGHQEAMFTMAMFNYDGEHVPTNMVESARLLSLIDPKVLPIAAEDLGLMTLFGEGVPKDIQRGLKLLETAVLNGRAESATILGRIHLFGELVPKDGSKARYWFLKAGEMGDPHGMALAGLMLGESKVPADRNQGEKLILAALSNDTEAAYAEIFPYVTEAVARSLEARNPPLATNDIVKLRRTNGTGIQGTLKAVGEDGLTIAVGSNAVKVAFADIDVAGRTRCDPAFRRLLARSVVLEKVFGLVSGFVPPEPDKTATNDMRQIVADLAKDGAPEAQAWFGDALMESPDTEREGLEWLKKSADAGCPDGQYALGLAYERGKGLPRDKAEALRLFRLAADQGHTGAMLKASRMLITGEGCERQEAVGLELMRKAADEMDPTAIHLMGMRCVAGKAEARDPAQAFAWFRLGAMLGTPESQYWLGRIYYEGNGLPQDYDRAIQWLMESAAQGYRPAVALLDSDAAQKQEMAKAKVAYKQELERHARELDRIKTNPKYDTVAYSKVPSFFRASEKAAYQRFADNYMKGRFGRNIAKCAEEAWNYTGSGGGYSSGYRRGSGTGSHITIIGRRPDGTFEGVGPLGGIFTSRDGKTWTRDLGGPPRPFPSGETRPAGPHCPSPFASEESQYLRERQLEAIQAGY